MNIKPSTSNHTANIPQQRNARKRALQIAVIIALATVALALVAFLLIPNPFQSLVGISRVASPSPHAPAFTNNIAFECATPFPTRDPNLPIPPSPTTAPPPTRNPNPPTTAPTRVRNTRVPRPTRLPTPTLEFLAAGSDWKTYSSSQFRFSFEYPAQWQFKEQILDPRFAPPTNFFPGFDDSSVKLFLSNYDLRTTLSELPDALYIQIVLAPAFCDGQTLDQAIAMFPRDGTHISTLTSHNPIGGYPAWQRTVIIPNSTPRQWLQVFVQRGKWLYTFQAEPTNSTQIAAFDHLLSTFSSP